MTTPNHFIECLSPAKLNLFLHVTGQRPNGYHELQTVFQLLDWGDEMVFERTSTGNVELVNGVPGVAEEDNLILRAASLLQRPLKKGQQRTGPGARITITKHIPMGGGLGGGSSNAASTLLMLNRLWELDRSIEELTALGLQLGADVPVFVRGHSAWAEGIGDQLIAMDLPERWYVILIPDCHVSTAEIFSAPELTRDTSAITMSAFFEGDVRNDLQEVVAARYPKVRKALNWLNKFAPAMMTGSGAAVFAPIDTEARARELASAAESAFDVVVARGINRSPPVVAHRN